MTFRDDWTGCNGDDSIGINYADGHLQEFELMQYTGLHDKNGVEIWEGDVVTERDLTQRYEVRWVGSGLVAYFDDWTWFLLDDRMDVKVIGNIYENPELLK